jgi:hypothetical protein
VEILEVDPITGKRTNFALLVRQTLRALNAADVSFAVVGPVALAVHGFPRMSETLDVVVAAEHALYGRRALKRRQRVNVLVASAEPESTVVAEAKRAEVFGVRAPVATLEHLVLMYLYSNQPRHLGDLARIVTETQVDLSAVERYLAEVHPEMLAVLRDRVRAARNPPPEPKRPPRRR